LKIIGLIFFHTSLFANHTPERWGRSPENVTQGAGCMLAPLTAQHVGNTSNLGWPTRANHRIKILLTRTVNPWDAYLIEFALCVMTCSYLKEGYLDAM
jgi:hypothetical protein